MLRYKAGYKYVDSGVLAQVVDFPAAISFGDNLATARQMLVSALADVAETTIEAGQPLPIPDSSATNPEMDIEEPIYLHLLVSSEVRELPAGALS